MKLLIKKSVIINCLFTGRSDIKDPISVGFTKKLKVEGLSDKLKHDKTYYFTVTAVNSAGLTSIDSCNITVEILPPDVSNVTLSYMFSDDEEIEEASLTSEDRDIGLEWDGGKDDVAFYGKKTCMYCKLYFACFTN